MVYDYELMKKNEIISFFFINSFAHLIGMRLKNKLKYH